MSNETIKELFILGAGASVPYGLPTWIELQQILATMVNDERSKENYSGEQLDQMEEFLKFTEEFPTIDEAIPKYVIKIGSSTAAHDFEDVIFSLLATKFKEIDYDTRVRKTAGDRWLYKLLKKSMGRSFSDPYFMNKVFLNYNYDRILQTELTNFYRERLEENPERRELNVLEGLQIKLSSQDKNILNGDVCDNLEAVIQENENALSTKKDQVAMIVDREEKNYNKFGNNIFYPHGNFGTSENTNSYSSDSLSNMLENDYFLGHGLTYIRNRKFIDKIGADARAARLRRLAIIADDARPGNSVLKLFGDMNAQVQFDDVYVIGLGGGFIPNIDKLELRRHTVKRVHYTFDPIRNEEARDEYFRARFGEIVEVRKYKDCNELIEKYQYSYT